MPRREREIDEARLGMGGEVVPTPRVRRHDAEAVRDRDAGQPASGGGNRPGEPDRGSRRLRGVKPFGCPRRPEARDIQEPERLQEISSEHGE